MIRFRRWHWIALAGFLLATVIAWFGWSRQRFSPQHDATKAAIEIRTARTSFSIAGATSCAGGGCHGNVKPVPASERCQQDEFVLWTQDRHAGAYRTLFSERSQKIAKLLGDRTQAHEDSRCLACHTNPLAVNLSDDNPFVQQERRFGVGCESCHGSANEWLVAHAAPDWHREKHRHSMPDLADPIVQAKTCAGCHVGAPADREVPVRDVNHDLIAAGHPRLQFEFGAYRANMPAHWRPKKHSNNAHIWVVGQVVSAQSALELTVHRAKNGPWPEFAEHDCFACHHALAEPSWRRQPSVRQRGVLPWGSWHFALTRELAGELPALDMLEKEMRTGSPDRTKAAAKAQAALNELRHLHSQLQDANHAFGEELARRRIVERLGKGELLVNSCWDGVEQLYLALHSVRPSAALLTLSDERAFLPEFNSPTAWPSKNHRAFDPLMLLEKLKVLAK